MTEAAPTPPRRARSLTRRIVRVALWAVLGLVVAFAIFFFWASGGDSDDRLVAPGVLGENPKGTKKTEARELKVLTFNIAYGRGPAGDASGPWAESEIRQGLDGIAAQIRDSDADLVFMQEVDLGASRSHDIDEGRFLLEATGLGYSSCVVTWEKNYVPFPYWPPSKHYGAMKSGQCILSRFPIMASTRHRLPQPEANAWWRNRFYLNRAIDHAQLDIGGRPFDVFNVHTEAFDADNRMEHARLLVKLVGETTKNSAGRVLVAGDFNAPPPEASQKKGFVDEPETDFSRDETIAIVRTAGLAEVLPDPAAFTFPADAPSRRLDYIWFGSALERTDAKVLAAPPGPWSDHLPVLARFTLKAP